MNSLKGKHVVITGGNRGIGLALTEHYQARGAELTVLCRKAGEVLPGTEVRVIEEVDVTRAESVALLPEQMQGKAIDILINNAGLLQCESLSAMDYGTILRQFEVNAMGPLRITEALLPLIAPGGKVALITSRMGSIADNGSGGYYGYRMSKAALNAAGMSLARDLKSRDIAVALLHPGFVQTEMVGFAGDISAEVAAERLMARIDELNMQNTGSFWHSSGEQLPW